MLEYLPNMLKAPGTRECHEAWMRGRRGSEKGKLGASTEPEETREPL